MNPGPGVSKAHVYRGSPPIHCCCDATFRTLPNGEKAVFFMTGGAFEPETSNFVVMSRSQNGGATWGDQEIIYRSAECEVDLFQKPPHCLDPEWRKRCVPGIAATLSEVLIDDGRITVFLHIHDGHFGYWRTHTTTSNDDGRTWSEPEEFAPLPVRSFVRTRYQTSWGEYLLPFQYQPLRDASDENFFDDPDKPCQQNGVLIGENFDGPWKKSSCIQAPPGWAEVNVVELGDESLVMLCRSENDFLYRSDSTDRGRTWSEYQITEIPNPASKFRLFKLNDGRIALLHNPSSASKIIDDRLHSYKGRNPLSLWISSDDLKTWSWKQDLCDFPGALQYPDGEVDASGRYIEFAFDYNRHDVIYWRAEVPPGENSAH